MNYIILLSLILLATDLWAFPEMVRHNYTQCTSCHLSMHGGGVLSSYGRELSREVLSTWGHEGEEQPLHGALPELEILRLSGHFRFLQNYLDNPIERDKKFFPMQLELGIGAEFEDWLIHIVGGVEGGPNFNEQEKKFILPEAFVQYRKFENIVFQAGKYVTPYGLPSVEHFNLVKRKLGFGPGFENYHFESSVMLDTTEIFVGGIFGGKNENLMSLEKGFLSGVTYFGWEGQRLGLTYLNSDTEGEKRSLYGLNTIFTVNKFVSTLEYNYQDKENEVGSVGLLRFQYEVLKGLYPRLTFQKSTIGGGTSEIDSQSLGIQWFPRPHWDFLIEYTRERDRNFFPDYYDRGWLLLHYWL